MNEKKTSNIKFIVTPIIFVIVVAMIVGALFSYNPLRLSRIKKQLKDKYGVEFTGNVKNINGRRFVIKSMDGGVSVKGTCDFLGNVKTESYVNYYYADDCVQDISDKIGEYFDDCIIVVDQRHYSFLYSAEFEFGSIDSYEEYLAATQAKNDMLYHVRARVYVGEDEPLEHVRQAKEYLESANEYIWVSYYAVPDDYYEALKESGIYCFNLSTYMDEFEHKYPDKYDEYFHYTYGNEGEVNLMN